MSVSYHMVHYRTFAAKGQQIGSLEEGCRLALSGKDREAKPLWLRPADRIMLESSANGDFTGRRFLMNRVADLKTAIFGEVCCVHEKDLQALLRLEAQTKALTDETDTAFFDLSEAEAPNGTHFIRGIGYWLAVGDHLFLITLQTVTPKQIIEYLAWLISVFGPPGTVITSDLFKIELDAAVLGEDSVGQVRSLKIKGNSPKGIKVPVETGEMAASAVPQRKSYSRRVRAEHKTHSAAMRIVEAVLGPDQVNRLVRSLGPEEYIAAEAEIRVKGARTEATLKNVKEIASAIADETDAHVEIEGKFGKIKDGDAILRMRMPFAVSNEGGTLLDFDNVAEQIQKVYLRFLEDGKIKAK
ncbi:hypothetical protein F8A10_11995 [Paracoccus kondratievae]|uniref:hypothetical protein n=1 Tax=Paracoccus kondratievae TaxID=135740 RepID=UPI00126667C9|nr:hypothetical protein [Paracoccus kondratievae]QFQ88233.1 hypothetical protein F8A10_11995 [Paracoccus kondratievae]